jgi:hypothetical protein
MINYRLFSVMGFLLVACAMPADAQLTAEIAPIADNPVCAGALDGISDPALALKTGCARFWPIWPATLKKGAIETDAQQQTRSAQEHRIHELRSIWLGAQITGRGHYALRNADGAVGSRPVPTQAPTAPAAQSVTPDIRKKCATEWADDFVMRAFCEKQQREAQAKLNTRAMSSGDQRTIRDKCTREWPDDFIMRDFCEEQQLKALGSLR